MDFNLECEGFTIVIKGCQVKQRAKKKQLMLDLPMFETEGKKPYTPFHFADVKDLRLFKKTAIRLVKNALKNKQEPVCS